MSLGPHTDPHNAPVLESDHHAPFARRSVNAVFGIVLAIGLVGGFLFWYYGFFSGEKIIRGPETNIPEKKVVYIDKPENPYPEGTHKNTVYGFFYSLMGGAAHGVEDSPLNLPGDPDERTIEALNTLEEHAHRLANIDDNYSQSIRDVVGSEVVGRKGDKAGNIHDIVVHKETGEAQAIIVDEAGNSYNRELAALSYDRVLKQDKDGNVLMTVTDNKFEKNREFAYSKMDDTKYVSLRHLRDGQLLDDQGEVAGQVNAIIYQNAEAQKIYFTIKPSLTPTKKLLEFGLPFEDVKIIQNPDGYDVQMTKEQTESLAEALYN